jgi:hypothetical protein
MYLETKPLYREQIAALFSSIFRLLDTAKPTVKESVFVIVGSLGK